MNTSLSCRISIALVTALVAFECISPAFALAQTATTSPQDGSAQSGYSRQQRIRGYSGQSSDLQQKINALGTASTTVVSMPVLFGVGVANISPNFGDPRDGGTRTHEGEDIMAVKGTPVVSPTAAVVLRTVTGPDEGNAVYTANPSGETFVYMHLDHFGEGVVSGTVLAAGALIGYVGDTGNAAGGPAHLHFEIHNSSGTPTDPFPRLTAELTLAQKMSYLTTILGQTADATVLAQFLVTNFRSDFANALAQNIPVPSVITTALSSYTLTAKSSATSIGLTRDLKRGMTGDDVLTLQKMLNAKGYTVATSGAGSVGNETTYFGPATEAAVIKFQTARGVTPAVGYVGPLTRAALAVM